MNEIIFLDRHTYERQNNLFRAHFGTTCPDWGGFVRDRLPEIDADYLVREIRRIESRTWGIPVSFYPNYTDDEIRRYYRQFDFTPSSYAPRCMSPWMVAYIFPDGSVRPCQSLNFSAGNVREQSFREIWNGNDLRAFRQVVKTHRMFPVCARCTELYRS